jgi:hypothetical protein
MQIENIKLTEMYQHGTSNRTGKAVLFDSGIVTLQDEHGDNFRVELHNLEYAPAYKLGNYLIDFNVNYPKERANCFLCRAKPNCGNKASEYECIGGADIEIFGQHKGKWKVDVNDHYDEETDSDSRILGYFDSQAKALKALWNEREKITNVHIN